YEGSVEVGSKPDFPEYPPFHEIPSPVQFAPEIAEPGAGGDVGGVEWGTASGAVEVHHRLQHREGDAVFVEAEGKERVGAVDEDVVGLDGPHQAVEGVAF